MSSNDQDDYRQIVDSICEHLKVVAPDAGELSENTDMTVDVAVDSASIMNLVFELEEEFDIAVPLNELSDVRTVSDLAKLIVKLRNT